MSEHFEHHENQEAKEQGNVLSGLETNKVDRRTFLRRMVDTAVAVTGSAFLPASTRLERGNKGEIVHGDSSLILDFFNTSEFKARTLEAQFKDRTFDESTMLQNMGVTKVTLESIKQGVPTNDEETLLFMLTALDLYYTNHGKDVSAVQQKANREFVTPPYTASIQSIVQAIDYKEITKDELGNPTLWMDISPDTIDEVIRNSPQGIMSMSLEMGRVGFKYNLYEKKYKYSIREQNRNQPSSNTISKDSKGKTLDVPNTTYKDKDGNRITKEQYDAIQAELNSYNVVLKEPTRRDFWPQDGYHGENTYANLSLLAATARKYPTKAFVAAGGNFSSQSSAGYADIREAKARLISEGLWSPNIITAAAYFEDQTSFPGALGTDFYVWQSDLKEEFDIGPYASFATPTVAEIVRLIYSEGIHNINDIRSVLQKLSDNVGDSVEPEYVLNFKKLRNRFNR